MAAEHVTGEGLLVLFPTRTIAPNPIFNGGDLCLCVPQLLQLLVRIHPRLCFVRIIQECKQTVVFVVREWIKFMCVTLSTLYRQSQDRLANTVQTIKHFDHAKLFRDNRSLFIDHAVAQKTSSDLLLLSRTGQQVAGNLLDDELVPRHVSVDGVNHPVSPDPLFALQIFFVAVGVGVPCKIQPVSSPFFAEPFVHQQRLDRCLRPLLLKLLHLVRRRRQSDQVEVETSSQQRLWCRFRKCQSLALQAVRYKCIDGIIMAIGRDSRFNRCDKRPVLFVVGTALNPLSQQFDVA